MDAQCHTPARAATSETRGDTRAGHGGASAKPHPALSSRDAAILDAVADGLRRYGPRKLTAQDVAEAAGISRMTVYRAMGSMDNAILLALTREFTQAVARVRAALPAPGPSVSGATRLAQFLDAGARAFAASELVTSVRTHQPELLEPYLSGRLGRSQEVVLAAIEDLRAEGIADGSIAPTAASALTLLFLLRGIALGAPLLRAGDAFDRASTEFGELLTAGLGTAGLRTSGTETTETDTAGTSTTSTDTTETDTADTDTTGTNTAGTSTNTSTSTSTSTSTTAPTSTTTTSTDTTSTGSTGTSTSTTDTDTSTDSTEMDPAVPSSAPGHPREPRQQFRTTHP